MGIYIFNWSALRKYLVEDEKDPNSSKDFGKDIIPKMNADGKKMVAYQFEGYWKDVGTIKSYWEANMDLLDENNTLNLYDRRWKIYSKNRHLPPHFIACSASVSNSLINEGCQIEGNIKNCVLFNEIHIEKDALVTNSVILSGARVESGASVHNAVIMENVVVKSGTVIGNPDSDHILLVSQNETVES
jgi:glucose-1-phosphate adenylyltransferase